MVHGISLSSLRVQALSQRWRHVTEVLSNLLPPTLAPTSSLCARYSHLLINTSMRLGHTSQALSPLGEEENDAIGTFLLP